MTWRSRCTGFWEGSRSTWHSTNSVYRGLGNNLHLLLRGRGHLEDCSLFECRRVRYYLHEANRIHTLRRAANHSFLLSIPPQSLQFLRPTPYTLSLTNYALPSTSITLRNVYRRQIDFRKLRRESELTDEFDSFLFLLLFFSSSNSTYEEGTQPT